MLSNIETKEVVQCIKRTLGKMKVRVYISIITPPPKKRQEKSTTANNDNKILRITVCISNSSPSYMEIQSRDSTQSPVNLRGLVCTVSFRYHYLIIS